MVTRIWLEKAVITVVTHRVGGIAFGPSRAYESAGISGIAIVARIADTVSVCDRSSGGRRKRRTVFEKRVTRARFEGVGRRFFAQFEFFDKTHVTQTVRGCVTCKGGV